MKDATRLTYVVRNLILSTRRHKLKRCLLSGSGPFYSRFLRNECIWERIQPTKQE